MHFVVYVDLESILKPVEGDGDITQVVEVGSESSSRFSRVRPMQVVSNVDPNFSRIRVMYRGKDAAEYFVRDLQQEAKQLFDDYIATPKPMLLTVWR